MKKVSIATIIVAVLALGVGGWVLWGPSASSSPTQTTNTTTTTIPLVIVPSEVGKRATVAASHLETVHLSSSVVMAPSVDVLRNHVISQSPLQGTEVPEGTVIVLTVSSGPV